MSNEWISTREAAEMLGLAPATMSRWAKKYDQSFARKIGRNYKVNRHAILKILRDGTMPALRDTSINTNAEVAADDGQEQLFR